MYAKDLRSLSRERLAAVLGAREVHGEDTHSIDPTEVAPNVKHRSVSAKKG
jgi:hypothetical protein